MKKIKALVVTTLHKGVFFGYAEPTTAKTITLMNCRMCVYWSVETKGVLGLAATGPLKGSRISPSVPSMMLQDVTACMNASDEAAKQWEKGNWDE